jgi:NADP-dependent 3-hydroxy acid dehydrogenase YdfG
MAGPLLKGSAFVTGAASGIIRLHRIAEYPISNECIGIGQATAFAFARHGIRKLALTDVNRSNLLATSSAIKSQFPDVEIETMELNVCDEKAVESSVAEAVKKFGRIDVGVNVAGIGGEGKTTAESEEVDWVKVIDVNLNGVWRSQRAQLRAMLKQE